MRILCLILACALLGGCERRAVPVTTAAMETAAQPSQRAPAPETTEETTIITEITEVTQEETVAMELADEEFVRVLDYLPGAYQELKYATEDNFTGQVVYGFQDAYLRYGTVKKLQEACADLEQLGLTVKIWDGFRPVSAQFALWEICPDPTFVANPNVGYSNHSRGNAVDLTLCWPDGTELEMPTGFDDFSPMADRDYADCTEDGRNNALILESIMEKHGFVGYEGEWWHFADSVRYPVEEGFLGG